MEIDAIPPSFLHYLVRTSAVIGGTWAMIRMINQHIHTLFNLQPSNWFDKMAMQV